MTKTLADMSAEEREECVGMWCDLETNKGIQQVVLYKMVEDRDIGPIAYRLSFTSRHEILGFGTECLTPRFDLPRAWTPDGQPVSVSKEYGQCEIGGTPDGAFATIVHVDGGRTEYAPDGTPHGEVYRWVGEWEQDNE